ncbi:MAG: hypothetical protein GC164_14890 [Phycisphaera sp.]|nr:hypothetical protein [Phycisphaera sp.]
MSSTQSHVVRRSWIALPVATVVVLTLGVMSPRARADYRTDRAVYTSGSATQLVHRYDSGYQPHAGSPARVVVVVPPGGSYAATAPRVVVNPYADRRDGPVIYSRGAYPAYTAPRPVYRSSSSVSVSGGYRDNNSYVSVGYQSGIPVYESRPYYPPAVVYRPSCAPYIYRPYTPCGPTYRGYWGTSYGHRWGGHSRGWSSGLSIQLGFRF